MLSFQVTLYEFEVYDYNYGVCIANQDWPGSQTDPVFSN